MMSSNSFFSSVKLCKPCPFSAFLLLSSDSLPLSANLVFSQHLRAVFAQGSICLPCSSLSINLLTQKFKFFLCLPPTTSTLL